MLARRALLAAGHTEAPESDAELHVINTCCITGEAEAKSRQSVRRSLRSAQQVFVGGCAVNLNAAQFGDIDQRVTPFVGTADDVAAAMGAQDAPSCVDLDHDVLARERTRRDGAPAGRTRGFIKVQDGCDGECAYCIIPTVRGSARSRPASAILAEAAERVARRPARDGDDRDQRGRLPRPRAGAGAGRADDGGGSRPRRAAGPALQRRGDPRARHAARGACHRAQGVPPPARPDAVRRRRRAPRDGPPLQLRRVPGARRPGARGRLRTSTSRPT